MCVSLQVLDRCSLITFAAYLLHNNEAWLFLEAPNGLPDKEKAGTRKTASIDTSFNRRGFEVVPIHTIHSPFDSNYGTASVFKAEHFNLMHCCKRDVELYIRGPLSIGCPTKYIQSWSKQERQESGSFLKGVWLCEVPTIFHKLLLPWTRLRPQTWSVYCYKSLAPCYNYNLTLRVC